MGVSDRRVRGAVSSSRSLRARSRCTPLPAGATFHRRIAGSRRGRRRGEAAAGSKLRSYQRSRLSVASGRMGAAISSASNRPVRGCSCAAVVHDAAPCSRRYADSAARPMSMASCRVRRSPVRRCRPNSSGPSSDSRRSRRALSSCDHERGLADVRAFVGFSWRADEHRSGRVVGDHRCGELQRPEVAVVGPVDAGLGQG